jgi:hypothetical protein
MVIVAVFAILKPQQAQPSSYQTIKLSNHKAIKPSSHQTIEPSKKPL